MMNGMELARGLPAICLTLLLSGCYLAHERGGSSPPPPPPPVDAGCVETVVVDGGVEVTNESVDLLLMVDNSNSMTEEQASLAIALPNLVRAITSGDVDFDGDPDFAPVGSLQLGVVTSDMGTGGFRVPTCTEPNFGDDGVLRTTSGLPRCEDSYPSFLRFDARGTVSVGDFASEAACLTTAGTGGCGFEQQLESVLKAVTPSTDFDIEFNEGTGGHGNGANAGFVRPDSILVVLVVTDENDCSGLDPEIFNPSSSVYSGDLNLRCFSFPGALHPIERYSEGLIRQRSTQPGRLVFGAIVGIPPDLDATDADRILSDPRVRERIDPDMPTRLAPSCNVADRGFAFPPTRIVQVGADIRARGGRAINLSICQEDFSPAVRLILDEMGGAARPDCVRP